jgi:sulfoxide reductase heme-binding subunit YedZ
VLDLYFDWETLVEDVIKRPYVTAGAVAYLCMLPLAVTSTRGWILRLGPRWTRLHRLVYVAGTAAIVHFAWGVKADLFEPAVYGALLAALFGLRWVIRERAKSKGQTMLGP